MSLKKEMKKIINEIEFEDIELLENEEWRDLKTDLYPEIREGYKISNKGRIYSNNSKRLLKNINKKYYNVSLMATYENCPYDISKYYVIHRLLMAIFRPIPLEEMKVKEINHKDGNKLNNDLSNLEWVTPAENIQHAFKTGLAVAKRGEECSFATVTENEVRQICELWLSCLYTYQEIADIIGTQKDVVGQIIAGGSWKHITKDYDFTKRDLQRRSKFFTHDELHNMCKYFTKHKKDELQSVRSYCKDVITFFQFDYDSKEYYEKLIDSIRKIYQRKHYKQISSQYNF